MRKPCRVCRRPSKSAICGTCSQAQQQARPSRQERGYDAEYDRARALITAGVREAWARGRSVACVICQRDLLPGCALTVEHITPLRDGGTNHRSNLGPAHSACNYGWRAQKKGARP